MHALVKTKSWNNVVLGRLCDLRGTASAAVRRNNLNWLSEFGARPAAKVLILLNLLEQT
jgi:hypothetical protein